MTFSYELDRSLPAFCQKLHCLKIFSQVGGGLWGGGPAMD
jgi:hypothetical protein